VKLIFDRCKTNPILKPQDLPFPAEAVLNPGAADTCVCLATARLADVLATLESVDSMNA